MISPVVISQGDIRVTVETRNEGLQPLYVSGLASDAGGLVITNTKLDVDQGSNDATIKLGSTTIGDLVQGLNALHNGCNSMFGDLPEVFCYRRLEEQFIFAHAPSSR